MNKKTLALGLGIFALGSLGSIAIQTSAAEARPFLEHKERRVLTAEEKTQMEKMHSVRNAIMKAFELKDYSAFHNAVLGNVKAEAVTEAQFNVLLEAMQIMKDADLRGPFGKGKWHGPRENK